MKNRIRFFGIAAISAAIGFALALSTAGCDSGGGGGNSQLTGTVSISGTAATGQTLTANTGSLGGSGSISYQWKRGNTNTGSNSSTYTVQEADIGFAITVTVTRPGWSGSVTSSPTAAVTDSSLPPLTGLVSISGNALVGETLTANTSALGGEGSVSYQWKRGAVSVGSDSGTYTLQTADAESAVTVTVTRSGCSGSVTSEPTELVALYGLKGIDGEDFGVRGVITNTFNVGSAAEWGEALSAISGGGNNNNYIINITADFFVTGRSSYNFMGSVSGVKVSLRGEGRTLTLTSGGSMAYAGSEQTVILRGLTLRGLGSNSTSLVYVSGGGAFTMQSGKLTGNTASSTSGVYVGIAGTFTMNGGEISGNTSSGMSGGIISVYQYGAFTMNGGEISGNTTYTGTFGGVRVNGGVVALNEGAFTMSGGEISGNTGCGVIIAANSAFDMYNGEISGNTADGVYIAAANGAFNMHNGEISGNSNGVNVAANGAFNMYNGEISSWVYVAANGTFNMHNGEISSWVYVAASGAFRIANGGVRGLNNSGTSQYGVFSGSTWDSAGAIYTTSHTVKIVNGVPYIGSLLANNYTFDVSDAEGWENAHNAINTYDNYSYTINVTADFDAAGRTDANIIRSGITVTVQGEGRTLGLSSGGSLIRTGSGQTIILKGLTLRGSVNNASLVYVNGGTFTMESGEISGNSNGVYVAANGAFTMESGEISGNTSSGVYVANGGAFRIANGIIYGTNEADTGLRNGVDGEAGAVLLNYGTAQYGVYSGSTWNSAGSVYTTSHTIKVVNGVPYIGSLPANNYTFNTATTADWDNAHNAINTYDNYSYTINVTSDFDAAGRTAANFIRTGIKVTVQGEGKTLGLSSYGSLIRTGSGQTIILKGLTLRGSVNNASLVYVNGGTFTMESGEISGNTASGNNGNNNGGGVHVGNGGTFTMSGGGISGNTASGNDGNSGGGGVHVGNGGTFTMSGGGISGNSTSNANNGGGVYVGSGGTFTMSGGGISGNTSSRFGGGVYVNYSSGNYGIFTKTGGGTVYGYSDESSANRNESNNGGHAVYVYSGAKRRETTAGPGVNLDSGVSGAAGGWEN